MKTFKAKSSVKRAIVKAAGIEEFEKGQVVAVGDLWGFVQECDKGLYRDFGTTHCPECKCHLDNGVNTNENQIDSNLPLFDKYEYMCLACNHEFGPEIKKVKTKRVYNNSSSVKSPCQVVWSIAESMGPESKRKDVLIECEKQGVTYYTARTQYQKYKEALRGDVK